MGRDESIVQVHREQSSSPALAIDKVLRHYKELSYCFLYKSSSGVPFARTENFIYCLRRLVNNLIDNSVRDRIFCCHIQRSLYVLVDALGK